MMVLIALMPTIVPALSHPLTRYVATRGQTRDETPYLGAYLDAAYIKLGRQPQCMYENQN
jgi:hypothetical protein